MVKQGLKSPGIWFVGFLFSLMLFHAPPQASAQEPVLDVREREQLISLIEEIAETTDQELDYTDLIDGLYLLMDNPVNLNYASFQEIKQLFFLSDIQVHKLIAYRHRYGLFVSIYELAAVEGFTRRIIELMVPFVVITQERPVYKTTFSDVVKYGRHDIFIRHSRLLQEQNGFLPLPDSIKEAKPSSYYLGSPDRLYLRYGFNYYNKFRFGLTADKDAGEEFFKGSQPNGFDFYSAFAWATDLGPVSQFVVGDYHLEFGQGLTLWTGLAFGKSSDGISIIKNQRKIRPNTSANENLFLRGTAATANFKRFSITGFYSSKKIDANVGDYDTISQEIEFVTSLQQTGFHRTNSEIENKNSIGETLFGGRVEYTGNSFRIGATGYKTQFDKPLIRDGQLYRQFVFQGTENLNYGADFNFITGRFNFFGEVSGSENGGSAMIAGFQASLHPQLSIGMFYRDYGVKYQNLYSNAIGEGSINQNERGIYAGFRFDFHRNWTLSGYADHYKFPWLRYRVDFPSSGREYLSQLDFRPARNIDMYFRFKTETKQLNLDTGGNLRKPGETTKQSFRYHISYAVMQQLTLKSRIEYLTYDNVDNTVSNGFLIYQDVLYRPQDKPYNVTFRYALFDTDDYNARIYAYENDVLYAFSIPGYFYRGSRFYILLKWKLMDNVDFWLRFAQTYYNDRQTIGTGLDEINGNKRSEIKMQLRVKF
jgi:hypothetical protein